MFERIGKRLRGERKEPLGCLKDYDEIVLAPAVSKGEFWGSRLVARADLVVVGSQWVAKDRYGPTGRLSNEDYMRVVDEVEDRLLTRAGFDPPDRLLG